MKVIKKVSIFFQFIQQPKVEKLSTSPTIYCTRVLQIEIIFIVFFSVFMILIVSAYFHVKVKVEKS